METRTALKRNLDGTVERVTVYGREDRFYTDALAAEYDVRTEALTNTRDETYVEGWGSLDGWTDVYETPAGIEILIPRRESR